jgi:hypothetical protein
MTETRVCIICDGSMLGRRRDALRCGSYRCDYIARKQKNPGRARDWAREWRANNPDKIKRYNKIGYARRRDLHGVDALTAKSNAWKRANPDRVRASNAASNERKTIAYRALKQIGITFPTMEK